MYYNSTTKDAARVTMDSFGPECPANWGEIAQLLNSRIDALEEDENGEISREAADAVWEAFWNAPDPEAVPCWHVYWVINTDLDVWEMERYNTAEEARAAAIKMWAAIEPERREAARVEAYDVVQPEGCDNPFDAACEGYPVEFVWDSFAEG